MAVTHTQYTSETPATYSFDKNRTFLGLWQGLHLTGETIPFAFFRELQYVASRAQVNLTPINEETIAYEGQKGKVINKGYEMEPFELHIAGGKSQEVFALAGYDNTTTHSLTVGQRFEDVGFLILNGWDDVKDGAIKNSIYVGNINIEIMSVPESTSGTNANWVVMVSSDLVDVRIAEEGYIWSPEIFYDNASDILNAAAPDGILTTFDFGDGNQSFSSPPASPSQAFSIRQDGVVATTAWKDWIPSLRVNGVEAGATDYTVTGSGTQLTAAAAPAATTILSFVVLTLDSNDDAMNYSYQTMDKANTWYKFMTQ